MYAGRRFLSVCLSSHMLLVHIFLRNVHSFFDCNLISDVDSRWEAKADFLLHLLNLFELFCNHIFLFQFVDNKIWIKLISCDMVCLHSQNFLLKLLIFIKSISNQLFIKFYVLFTEFKFSFKILIFLLKLFDNIRYLQRFTLMLFQRLLKNPRHLDKFPFHSFSDLIIIIL